MGGHRVAWVVASVLLASSGAIGCGSSTSSSNGGAGLGGGAGRASGGTSGQGDAGRPSGGGGAGGTGGSSAGAGGRSGSGGSAGASAGSGGTAGGSGAAATGGVSGSAGAAGEGVGDAAGESSGSGGRPPSIDCSGTFGEPRVVFKPGGVRLFSPTVSADETELLYAMGDDTSLHFFRSTRASKVDEFGEGVSVPELDAACEVPGDRTIDLTPSGLRAYLVCYGPDASFELRIAARPTLDAPFVLDPKSYGQAGPSAAVAPSELTLYSSGHQPGEAPPLVFERATTVDSFGAGRAIPGLEETLLLTPDASPDGLSLFGSLSGGLVVATRATPNDDFTLGEVFVPSVGAGEWISPTISEDCRSLYAVRQARLTVEVFAR